MACCSCNHEDDIKIKSAKFKIALWIALILNLSLFFVEVFAGIYAGSTALWADALDFFGDSINYLISLVALGFSLYWRATIALIKGVTMIIFALMILMKVTWSYFQSIPPEAITMGSIGIMALIANIISALVLYAFRDGDANMQSVWLCSRNDAIGNIAVMIAALGVLGTQSVLPDLIVAVLMACLALSAGWEIIQKAQRERTK